MVGSIHWRWQFKTRGKVPIAAEKLLLSGDGMGGR